MTKDTDKAPIWSLQQQQALAALKLTLWQRHAENESNPHAAEAQVPAELYCYKAGQWLLVSEEPLRVELSQWLKDLTRACSGSAERPAELSASAVAEWQDELMIRLPPTQPTATVKKQLWQQLAQFSS
ncbi:hypothetical protein [Pseudidiomarina aquimaris]|uniref:hypothetical protein n=1 Tax=Pseudidiomarina aquimaris TaxID=641841 RepID=UPI003A96D026